ncbi:polysaccharide biosynthesis tyrosine autokinase [candidate division KSB1 bacterium]|nr:polysaccharide biosynthesis tyrosine autokinase [candidate division KSB1 bacterium]
MDNNLQIKEITLRDYIDLALRRKWIILSAFIVVFLGSIYYNFTRPPVYDSMATFIIESNEPMLPMMGGVKISEAARPFEFYNAVVNSRIFREQAIHKIVTTMNDSLKLQMTHAEAYSLLAGSLSMKNSEYTDFIELHVQANDPKIAYLLANVAARTLKERCQEIDREESMNIVNFVSEQKNTTLSDLESVEKNLQEFKETNDAFIAGENGGLVKELVEMESELMNIQTQRELAESNLKEYHRRIERMDTKVNQSLDETESPEIARLRKEITELEDVRTELLTVTGKSNELTNLGQKIDDKKRELIRVAIQSVSNPNLDTEGEKILWQKLLEQKVTEELNVATLRNREAFYLNLIANFKKKHPNLLDLAIKLNQMKRAKSVHENLYGFLFERGEEAKIKAATGTGGIRIVDPPNWPRDPNPRGTMKNLMLGALLGLGLGIGLAFFREYLDHTIRTPEDVTTHLQQPVIGVIPIIHQRNYAINSEKIEKLKKFSLFSRKKAFSRSVRLIHKLRPKNPIVETYRGLRTNLQFTEVDQKLRTILITSTNPQEGKTVTAANLALAFAEVGLKTVLVDTDLRKPKQHLLFEINREPGLLEYMVGEKRLDEVQYPIENTSLRVIPSGKIPPNPTQVLASQKMEQLIKTLEAENDLVIFDSPPLAAVTDPILLSKHLGGVILVVRFEFTDINAAKNSIETLKNAHCNILGVVLNSTEYTKGYGYYNRYYTYSQYYDEAAAGQS